MDGAIHTESENGRPLVRTGPIELRDVGPNGRPLGTPDDCCDDSPWELHRGELVERLMAYDIHALVIAVLSALFGVHARDNYTAMADIDCVLDDEFGESRRAPDVAIVHDLKPKNEAYRGTPVLAVEVRASQSKKYLEEKVKLYLEHDWPIVWIVHTERREVEVLQKGLASVVYRPGASVPLLPVLDKYGLSHVPVDAFFDRAEASKYIESWVQAKGRASGFADGRASGLADGRASGLADGRASGLADGRAKERANAVLDILTARRFDISAELRERILSCNDLDTLQCWFTQALTATNVNELIFT
ncbi:MAG TPA: Uma2 family endonuclease [Polyangium sp.]|nr:Uma2 family endonuclease [Polyangium sp.]